jgi:hypothetical protein
MRQEWKGRQPSSRRQQPEDAGPRTTSVDIVVHRPARTCYQYRHDAERRTLTLAGVCRVPTALPGDLAHLHWDQPSANGDEKSAMATYAGPTILLLSAQPNPPGTHIRARLLGGMQLAPPPTADGTTTGAWLIVAVPAVDPAYAALTQMADLPPETQAAISRLVYDLAPTITGVQGTVPPETFSSSLSTPNAPSWCSAEDAMAAIRQATAAQRRYERERQTRPNLPGERLHVHDRDSLPPAAWRAVTGVSPRLLHERGMDAYAEAEHLLQYIPLRFQRYLGELLLGDERVLMFIERPALTVRAGPLHLRTRHLAAGMLLITDRQALWLRDFAGPDATMVAWGYVARSCPVERLSAACLIPAGAPDTAGQPISHHARLVIHSAARQGTDALTIEFPADLTPALEQATRLIASFLPLPGSQSAQDRRLRRVPHVEPWQPHANEVAALEGLGGLIPPDIQKQLEATLSTALEPGESTLVRAFAPAIAEARVGPRLLALTARRVILLSMPAGRHQQAEAVPEVTSWPLAAIAAAQLQHSLLGCSISLAMPAAQDATGYPSIPFNSPAIVPFRALFTRLRLLLADPMLDATQELGSC